MVKDFAGIKYRLEKSENFDEYLKAVGVGYVLRKMATSLPVAPVVDLAVDGDMYTITSTSTFRTSVLKFKIGEEFEQELPDGSKVPTTVTIDGNKVVEKQTGAKPTTIVREFSKDELKMTLSIDDVVCTRIYKAIP